MCDGSLVCDERVEMAEMNIAYIDPSTDDVNGGICWSLSGENGVFVAVINCCPWCGAVLK